MNRVFKFFMSINIFTVGILLAILPACVTDPASYLFDKDELLQNVSSVELIYYDSDYEYVHSKDQVEPFYYERITVIKTLPEEKIEALCVSISEFEFMICDDQLGYNSSACGTSILLRLRNGNVIVMSDSYTYNNFVAEYDGDGQLVDMVLSFSSRRNYQKLMASYFLGVN